MRIDISQVILKVQPTLIYCFIKIFCALTDPFDVSKDATWRSTMNKDDNIEEALKSFEIEEFKNQSDPPPAEESNPNESKEAKAEEPATSEVEGDKETEYEW